MHQVKLFTELLSGYETATVIHILTLKYFVCVCVNALTL